ncbi:MAG TPA: FkbM family methyltransferase [Acidobacteriaceae bacterium]|nr:FkbM family methyltransferase [Acidobacteriaceae bacterium]HUO14476.1 FkbM family methyltransferase [Verrucomicrobiae bacterium]
MKPLVRKLLTSNRLSRRIYHAARQEYRTRQIARKAKDYFVNFADFKRALRSASGFGPMELRTKDGLTITIRGTRGEAVTVAEVLLEDLYVRHTKLPPNPVVIDIGGFVGDFAVYAAKYLKASRVIVCEPYPSSWKLLLTNIFNNGYQDQITPVNKAVTDGSSVQMNIDAPDDRQCEVSAYSGSTTGLADVPGISLAQLLRDYSLDVVDLLKIDCEGGEYAIIESTSSEVFTRIRNIVFEYHPIEDGWNKLEKAKHRLRAEKYVLHDVGRGIISATR